MTRSRHPAPRGEGGASDTAREERIREGVELARAVAEGSIPHWHTFVDRYAGLIYSVIRRQLFAESEDDVRNVFADVLDVLYRGKLAEFAGRADLSTWLIVVSRGRALDYLRSQTGRRKRPRAMDELSAVEQEVFRLHFVEGLSFEGVIHSLESAGRRVSADDVANAVIRIESMMDPHYLRRLEYAARAPAMGVASGRILRLLGELQIRYESNRPETPERAFERTELEAMGRRVRSLLNEMSDEEREVMRLRFEEEWTARRISDELGLSGPRRVYTLIDQTLRKLRNLLK